MAIWTGLFISRGASKKKSHCCGDIIHVPAACLVDVIAGKKVDVGGFKSDMLLKLPLEIHIQRSPDVKRAGADRGNCDETGRGINCVVLRIAPEDIRATVEGNVLRKLCTEVGMEVYQVLRAQEAGVIEVAGLEIKCVECSLRSTIGIAVAACDIRFQSEPRLQRCIPCVAGIKTCRP